MHSTPPDGEPIDIILIDRYLSGTSTSPERAAVDSWIASSPEHMTVVNTLRAVLPGEQMDVSAWDVILARRVLRTPGRTGRSGVLSKRALALPPRHSVLSGASAIVLGTLLVFAGWVGAAHHLGRRSPTMETYATANGERATITLTDGSVVVLNVGSRLDIPADYTGGNHTVRLVGEALFTVSHHDGMPFTVLTGPTATRVLGTSFVVQRYRTDTATMVAVREGKVAVGSTIVTAGRYVEASPSGAPRLLQADASQFGFAVGVLTLSSMPLSQAVPELERWYAVKILVKDPSLAHVPIEGKFVAGSVTDIMDDLETMLNARVVRDGRLLILYPRTN